MQKKDIDVVFSMTIIIILFFGLVMISSVSVYSSYTFTLGRVARGLMAEPENSYYMIRMFIYVFLGILAMILFSKIPYHVIEKYSKHIFWTSFLLLLAVFIPGISQTSNGATGWINIKGLPSIQPVEFAKLGLIIMLAFFLKRRRSIMKDFLMGFVAFFMYVLFIIIPLALQPDFGSILILVPITLAMYYVGGGNGKYIIIAFIVAIIGAFSVYGIGKMQQSSSREQVVTAKEKSSGVRLSYISTRIDNFFRDNKDIALTKDKSGSDYQLRNAFIALGSGGFFGLGFGASIQKFGYLPEVHGDFIFSVITEELGFVGGLGVIICYLFITYRGYTTARSVKDLFAKYLAFGITTWFVVQAFINIGVNLNVVPLTGVTLPFVSYGGSSIVSLSIAAGILLSISRHIEVKPQNLSEALQTGRKVIF